MLDVVYLFFGATLIASSHGLWIYMEDAVGNIQQGRLNIEELTFGSDSKTQAGLLWRVD